jgi:GH43 family beta-xylosidase
MNVFFSCILSGVILFACGSIVSSSPEELRTSGKPGAPVLPLPPLDRPSLGETTSSPFNTQFYNPVKAGGDMGDPFVIRHNGKYYYTQTNPTILSIWPSSTLSGLAGEGENDKKVLLRGPDHGLYHLWTPVFYLYQGQWYCYFAARTSAGLNPEDELTHRVYVMKTQDDDLMGNWSSPVKLNIPGDKWAIANFPFVINDKLYLCFTGLPNDDAYAGDAYKTEYLYLVELNASDPTEVISTTRTVMTTPTKDWEKGTYWHTEGAPVYQNPSGTWYCFYSANWAGSNDYCVGQLKLVKTDPLAENAWEKSNQPVFKTNAGNDVYGPGCIVFTKSPDNTEDWIIYHAARRAGEGYGRNARIQKFTWKPDGTPNFGDPVPLSELQDLPSGETVDRILVQAEDMELKNGAEITTFSTVQAVEFPSSRATASAVVNVPAKGKYAVYVRHSNTSSASSEFYVRVNNGKISSAEASIGGNATGKGTYTMAAVVLPLEDGKNLLTFSATQAVKIDLVILDKKILD